MILTWDNIDDFRLTRRKDKFMHYFSCDAVYFCECNICGNLYTNSRNSNSFCSPECRKVRYSGENNPFYGKKHSDEIEKRVADFNRTRKNETAANWKGGFNTNNIPSYDLSFNKLIPYEKCRRTENGTLEVKCTYCDKWFISTYAKVNKRILAIEGKVTGEHRFYCSKSCQNDCDIFNQKKTPKGNKVRGSSREVQPELRKMVLARDNWECIKCGATERLHCHHIDMVICEPILSADIDNCITLCYECHKEAHKQEGCVPNKARKHYLKKE